MTTPRKQVRASVAPKNTNNWLASVVTYLGLLIVWALIVATLYDKVLRLVLPGTSAIVCFWILLSGAFFSSHEWQWRRVFSLLQLAARHSSALVKLILKLTGLLGGNALE